MTTFPLPLLSGAYAQRIAYDTAILVPGQVWYQTDTIDTGGGVLALAGPYYWVDSTTGWVFDNALIGGGTDIDGRGQNLGMGGSVRVNNGDNDSTMIMSNPTNYKSFVGLWRRVANAASYVIGLYVDTTFQAFVNTLDGQVLGLWSYDPVTGGHTRLLDVLRNTANGNKISAQLRYGSDDDNYGQIPVDAHVDVPDSGNTGASETDVKTWSLAPNSLVSSYQGIEFSGYGTYAANANNKRFRIVFGAATLIDTGSLAANATPFTFRVAVYRTGAASQYWSAEFHRNGVSPIIQQGTASESLAAAISVVYKLTGTASNEIVLKAVRHQVFN